MKNKSRNNNILYEVVPIRLVLIVLLVFYHAFAVSTQLLPRHFA